MSDFRELVRERHPIEEVIGADIELKKSGKERTGLCPFHGDKNPSLYVSPEKGTWHCFGCGAGGDVFDWVMRQDSVDFMTALEKLTDRAGMERPDWTPEQKQRHAERQTIEQILTMAAAYYHATLPQELREQYYRDQYGFTDDTVNELQLGFADGELVPYLIKDKGMKAEDLVKTGLAIKTGGVLKDFFNQRLIFPYWRSGHVAYLIGRKTHLTPDTEYEQGKYKKLPTHGRLDYVSETVRNDFFYGEDAVYGTEYVLITEGITDCIAARQAGIPCLSPATTRFREQDRPRLLKLTERIPVVYLCNDTEVNRAGERGAIETARALQTAGKTVYLVELPRPGGVEKVDLNDFLKEHTADEFRALMDRAITPLEYDLHRIPKETPKPRLPALLKPVFERMAEMDEAEALLFLSYTIKERFGLTARDIEAFRKSYAEIRRQIANTKLLKQFDKAEKSTPEMSDEAKQEASAYLRDPHLLERIQRDIAEAGGIIGEENNIKFTYLAATSRLMSVPISATVFAQSSAGKSHLINTVAEFIPREGKLILSSVSAMALEYADEGDIAGKFLVIQELDGAEEILPKLRALQSEGRLARLVTIKDPETNQMRAIVDEKEIACSVAMTTTVAEMDDQNSTRIFEVYIDESIKQTEEIVRFNLSKTGLDYLTSHPKREKIKRLHHNVQRLLEPLEVVVPYADYLQFPSETVRNRRDSARFMQLIKVIAFLHQKQREIKAINGTRYVEASLEDYLIAYEIGISILRQTLDELSTRSRTVLKVVKAYVDDQGGKDGITFTVKDIQHFGKTTGEDFANYRNLLSQLKHLADLGYLKAIEGSQGKTYVFALSFEGDVDAPMVKGLLTANELQERLEGDKDVPF